MARPMAFLAEAGTVYLIAEAVRGSPGRPLFAAMASEIHWIAALMGQASASGRLDPPLLMGLVISSLGRARRLARPRRHTRAWSATWAGADDPAEPGHRGDRQQRVGDLVVPVVPVASAWPVALRPAQTGGAPWPPMRTSCGPAPRAWDAGPASSSPGCKPETGLVARRSRRRSAPAWQRLLESHRLAHTASARTPCRHSTSRPDARPSSPGRDEEYGSLPRSTQLRAAQRSNHAVPSRRGALVRAASPPKSPPGGRCAARPIRRMVGA